MILVDTAGYCRFTASDFGCNSSLFRFLFGKCKTFHYLDICKVPITCFGVGVDNVVVHKISLIKRACVLHVN